MKKTRFEAPDINLVEELTAQLFTANRDLESALGRLRESENARMEMVQNISHDLRAPLTAIRSVLDRLLGGGLSDETENRTLVEIMDRRVSSLEHLVSELYYSISIENPGFVLNMEAIPLTLFLEEWFVTRKCDEALAAFSLQMEVPDDFDGKAAIDPSHMVRVLDNLLNNAIRFSEPGGRIILGCRKSARGGFAEIYLRDFGCGIAHEDVPRIFERTYTASNSRTPAGKSGSGLGLSIAKTIVEKHGGRIFCESVPQEGSTFIILIPVV